MKVKHTLTINVEMFGRETPVELNFLRSETHVTTKRTGDAGSWEGHPDNTTHY